MNLSKKYLMVYLLTAGLLSWTIVYLPALFYIPFLEAFQLTHEQLGTLLSVFGIISIFGYIFGGVVADNFSPKKLMVISSIASGVLGMYMATFPSYSMLMAVYLGFGVTATLLNWAAFLKSVRMMGDEFEQGQLFGAFESFAGILFLVMSYVILGVFSKLIAKGQGFEYVIMTYSGLTIFFGILIALLYNPEEFSVHVDDKTTEKKKGFDAKLLIKALKLPVTWFNGIIVLTLFIILSGGSYFNPLLNSVYGLPVSLATAVGISIKYGLRIFAAPVGGKMIYMMGKSSRVMAVVSVLLIATGVVLVMMPRNPEYLAVVLIVMTVYLFASNMGRPTMYVPMAEAKVSIEVVGTVAGITSAIGYSSDIWVWKLFGYFIDKHGNEGYNYILGVMIGSAVVLLIIGVFYGRYVDRINIKSKASS